MRFSRRFLGALIPAAAAITFAVPAAAQRPGPIRIGTLQIPAPTGYVNDFANALDAQSEAAIQAVIDDVRAKSGGAEIVVVTLPSLEDRPVDDVAIGIARGWGIGSRGEIGDSVRNVGTLVLVAPNDRRVRIEVSAGANNFLTAAETGRIQDQYMVPAFRNGDYAAGIRLGVQALAQEYARHFGFALSPGSAPPVQPQPPAQQPRGRGGLPPALIFFIVIMIVSFLMNRGGGGGPGGRRRRGWRGPIIIPFPMGGGGWGGGGFGGGGGGGGFGGFGGGGDWGGGGSDRGW
ncbi:MAG TPA: TPM domain-containing protein [Longimicrobium sp.]|nr:TPM domain-containing protein [Longimicrobium sp.]